MFQHPRQRNQSISQQSSCQYYLVVALTWFVIGVIFCSIASLSSQAVSNTSAVPSQVECICEQKECPPCVQRATAEVAPVNVNSGQAQAQQPSRDNAAELLQRGVVVAWDYIDFRYHVLSQSVVKTNMYNNIDFHEHMEPLAEYSRKVEHVTEMGIRACISSFALLHGRPKTYIGYDLALHPCVRESITYLGTALQGHMRIETHEADDLFVEIEETDLLFIDTLHSYGQLKLELVKKKKSIIQFILNVLCVFFLPKFTIFFYNNM
jgi:hypothetical protein